MHNLRPLVGMAVMVGLIVGCSRATPAASTGGSTATPTPAPVTGGATTLPGGGSGSAHYDITGPDSASGDVTFFNSILLPNGGTNKAGGVGKVIFTPKPGDPNSVTLIFPAGRGATVCSAAYPQQCGSVRVTSPTLNVQDAGWRRLPAPGRPSCTWDTAKLTAHGGTGSVVCTNGLNSANPTAGAYHVKITFTYADPNPRKL